MIQLDPCGLTGYLKQKQIFNNKQGLKMNMPLKTKHAMVRYAHSLEPSTARAQCLNIASYKLQPNETISQRLERDHKQRGSVYRAATLMVCAGCAKEERTQKQIEKSMYGKFIFEDGSILI